MLDADTFTSPESWDIARLAAGAVVLAGRTVMAGETTRAAALVRPPGHHALPDRAMGFCLLNNVAIAAADLIDSGVPRVAIVDIDVHHGNGTQAIFARRPDVLYVSLHQWPFYPGTGAVEEVGIGDGAGRTVNVPLPAWCVDQDYELAFTQVVVPILRAFEPAVIFMSAGFDAHERDPLAKMRLTEAGFGAMTRHLVGVADACCAGRLVLATEGGYELAAFASSLDASLAEMAGLEIPWPACEAPEPDPETTLAVRAMVNRVRRVQSAFWRGL
jgi:acetoin utilization deacetylase AcuC-like enzyme